MQMSLEKSKEFSTLPDHPIPADAAFECLGRVEFNGAAYLGYRARLKTRIVTISEGLLSEARQQELTRKLQQMPQEWRTVFVDPESALPAYDLVAQENQLDSPSSNVRYTYPSNIKIEPLLWCRGGVPLAVKENRRRSFAAPVGSFPYPAVSRTRCAAHAQAHPSTKIVALSANQDVHRMIRHAQNAAERTGG
jgi:hypothetical protein